MGKKSLIIISVILITATIAGCGKKSSDSSFSNTDVSMNASSESTLDTNSSVSVDNKTSIESKASEDGDNDETFAFSKTTFPIFDGSTSLKPLGIGIASHFLDISREEADDMLTFHMTDEAYYYLMYGSASILIAAEGCDEVMEVYKEHKFEYEKEPIAMEGLVFVVNKNNPVDSLTVDEIKGIYSGRITNWSQVGGNDCPIIPFQRTETSGSQVMMRKCVMTDCELTDAPTELRPSMMGALIDDVASYNNSANAIGYTVYYYADSMKMANGLKILNIDGIEPNNETIGSQKYPFTNPYYCIIKKGIRENAPARRMYNWLVSKEGQEVVASEGYVAIGCNQYSEKSSESVSAKEKYTRLKDDYIGQYIPGTAKGYIFPYKISYSIAKATDEQLLSVDSWGLVDETGMIVSDYGYSNITYKNGWYICDDYKAHKGPDYVQCFIRADGMGSVSLEHKSKYADWSLDYDITDDRLSICLMYADNNRVPIRKLVYNNRGELLSDELYDLDEMEEYLPNDNVYNSLKARCFGMQGDRYIIVHGLKAVNNSNADSGEIVSYSVFDTKAKRFILKDYSEIKMCKNYTFIAQKYDEENFYLYDCDGNQINNVGFKNLFYLDNDYYCSYDENLLNVTVYNLKLGKFEKVNEKKVLNFLADGKYFEFYKGREDYEYTDNALNVIDISKDAYALVLSNARKRNLIYSKAYSDFALEKRFVEDIVAMTSERPYAYGVIHDSKNNNRVCSLVDLYTNQEVIQFEKNKDQSLETFQYYVFNGVFGTENALYKVSNGECIFYYDTFMWNNID